LKTIPLGQTGLQASRLAYGCMRLDGETAKHAVMAAFDAGYTLFDHADIYGDGTCEALFGEVLRESPGLRDKILIQSKCGIRKDPARYDFSRDYIIQSVEGSLGRLGIEQLDLFLLHRPDYLMHAGEVAEAFATLKSSGKVAHFGVSNFSTSQVDLLQSALTEPLLINQVEVNIHNIDAFENGVLDQCQRSGIIPQAWCPIAGVAYPAWGNTFSDADNAGIRSELDRQSAIYDADDWIIALAWLLKHPAMISPIIGSTRPSRIAAATTALNIDYSREDWYRLLEAREGQPVP
jgi:predicted oxidoreductase